MEKLRPNVRTHLQWLKSKITAADKFDFSLHSVCIDLPSVLWHCWLVVRKSIWTVKTWVMRLSLCSKVQVICIWSSWCRCHSVISCFIKIQTGLTFLVPACPGYPGKEAIKRMSVCQFAEMMPQKVKQWVGLNGESTKHTETYYLLFHANEEHETGWYNGSLLHDQEMDQTSSCWTCKHDWW